MKQDSTCAFFAQVQTEGKRQVERQIPIYNLDMIISVGYRVNSHRGVQFRQWASIGMTQSKCVFCHIRKSKGKDRWGRARSTLTTFTVTCRNDSSSLKCTNTLGFSYKTVYA